MRGAARSEPSAEGEQTAEFFDALGLAWQLTAAERSRLSMAVRAALDAGWTPQRLAQFAGLNTDSIRNPYAVLTARLSAAELPPPPGLRLLRPPWCGECDERTRMADFYGDASAPCTRCRQVAQENVNRRAGVSN